MRSDDMSVEIEEKRTALRTKLRIVARRCGITGGPQLDAAMALLVAECYRLSAQNADAEINEEWFFKSLKATNPTLFGPDAEPECKRCGAPGSFMTEIRHRLEGATTGYGTGVKGFCPACVSDAIETMIRTSP